MNDAADADDDEHKIKNEISFLFFKL